MRRGRGGILALGSRIGSIYLVVLLAAAGAAPALSQTVSGHVFEDRDGDGIQDPGEPGIPGLVVDLFGRTDAGGSVDSTQVTPTNGAFSFSPGSGCYLLLPRDPAGWRMSQTREDGFGVSSPGYTFPIGQPRFAKMDQGIDNLKSGGIRYTSMGDSIAWNWNVCGYPASFWYSSQVQSRIACAAPSASVTLDKAAVKGEHTDDLLVDDTNDLNNVFRVIPLQPELVTISMIGNDLLDAEPPNNPNQTQINKAVAEVLDARQNLQEAISILVSALPDADIALNTLYDNLAYNCYTGNSTPFHREWIPIVNRILRDLAWGQARRVSVNEAAAEFAHEDQTIACTGFDGMICRVIFNLDDIHPTNNGYTIMREKVWEADGGVNLGPKDALSRTTIAGADYGFLRRVRRLLPTAWELRNGASVIDGDAALDDQDGGLPAQVTLGAGSEELRLDGFPDWYDEVQIVRTVAGVRYRTTGTVTDDFYRMEASINDQFRPPPGHAYTATDWNYYTPIVGGGGPNQPPENPDYPSAKLLAVPSVTSYREVSATLTKNPVLPPGAAEYVWPPVDHTDLSTATIRVAAAPVAGTTGNDNYRVELDAAWLDLYGWEKPRPVEVANLRADRLPGGTVEISFDPVPGAQRYNLYWGRIATVATGAYDHGAAAPAGPDCGATTLPAAGGRLKFVVPPGAQPGVGAYVLVTAHVSDVESPAGTRSDSVEIDRSQSICH